MLDRLPALGVGIGFREPFRSDVFLRRKNIDFLEITADHYLDATSEKLRELDLLAEHFVLIPHALNLSLGSAEGIDKTYLTKLAALVRRIDPPWWSEHLSFTRAGGVDIGHLTPTPFTSESAEVLTRNIEGVRNEIAPPLILENITYMLTVPGSEMSESDFLRIVVERTDTGLLLDITNLFINSVNHRYDRMEFLRSLPLDRVVQLHFVGGHKHGEVLIDSHSHGTPEEVWELMDSVLELAPVKGAVLERDENIPPFEEIEAELVRARKIGRLHGRWD